MDNAMLGSIMIGLTKVPQYWGLLLDVITKMLDKDFASELTKFARHEPCWINGQVLAPPKPTPSILELVSTVVVPATTSKFVAKDKFVVNTERNAPVKISYLSDNFKTWFLNGDGKTEDPISEQTLCYHKLRQFSVDGPIITELGGEVKAETTLSEMFSFMEKQKHGEDGVLLNNGWANIFYIKDSTDVLRAVCVLRYYGHGWYVYANSVGCLGGWNDDFQVFSRNPSKYPVPVSTILSFVP